MIYFGIIFTFYSSSIKSLEVKTLSPHGTKFTFYSSSIKRNSTNKNTFSIVYLHSTLVLLKVSHVEIKESYLKDLHSTLVLLKDTLS